MAPKPLVVYYHNEHVFHHPRRVYVAARSRTRAWQISGISQDTLKGAVMDPALIPPWITEEGCWLEIRDHAGFGWMYAKDEPVPDTPSGFIRCRELASCREALTLVLNRAVHRHLKVVPEDASLIPLAMEAYDLITAIPMEHWKGGDRAAWIARARLALGMEEEEDL
jgi:hypothetical protein